MGSFYESLESELGKPSIRITFAAATVFLAGSAYLLSDVERSSSNVTLGFAGISFIGFLISIWFGHRLEKRKKLARQLRRAEEERREALKAKLSPTMSEETLKVLRYFFYNDYDLSVEDIKLGFSLARDLAQAKLDELVKRKYIKQTTISGAGSDAECYALTQEGRSYVMQNMFK